MKRLPAEVVPYKRTPVFEQHSVPAGLLKRHSTKAGVWGKIVVRLTRDCALRFFLRLPRE